MPNYTIPDDPNIHDKIVLKDDDSNQTSIESHTDITEDYTIILPPDAPKNVGDI